MPWESLLVMAMRKYRNHERTIVYRHIRGLDPHSEAPKSKLPLKALFVETAPGKFRNEFDFGPQFQAVKGFLNGVVLQHLKHPSLADLETFIAKEKPAIIHVSGIDGSLGIQILKRLAEEAARTPARRPVLPKSSGKKASSFAALRVSRSGNVRGCCRVPVS